MHQRTRGAAGSQKVENQVHHLSMENRWSRKILPSGRRSSEHKNSGTNNRADAERGERPRSQSLFQTVMRFIRLVNQFVDRFAAEKLIIRSADGRVGGSGWFSQRDQLRVLVFGSRHSVTGMNSHELNADCQSGLALPFRSAASQLFNLAFRRTARVFPFL